MALDLCQNSVSAQYLEKELTEFHALILARSRLGLIPVIFGKFVPELWP